MRLVLLAVYKANEKSIRLLHQFAFLPDSCTHHLGSTTNRCKCDARPETANLPEMATGLELSQGEQ
ncbi:hypothetical protein [Bellilinea sp.]